MLWTLPLRCRKFPAPLWLPACDIPPVQALSTARGQTRTTRQRTWRGVVSDAGVVRKGGIQGSGDTICFETAAVDTAKVVGLLCFADLTEVTTPHEKQARMKKVAIRQKLLPLGHGSCREKLPWLRTNTATNYCPARCDLRATVVVSFEQNSQKQKQNKNTKMIAIASAIASTQSARLYPARA